MTMKKNYMKPLIGVDGTLEQEMLCLSIQKDGNVDAIADDTDALGNDIKNVNVWDDEE